MSDKLKKFTNYIKQDFDVVEDYKASKEIAPKEDAMRSITLLAKGTGTMEDVEILQNVVIELDTMKEQIGALIEELNVLPYIGIPNYIRKNEIRSKLQSILKGNENEMS